MREAPGYHTANFVDVACILRREPTGPPLDVPMQHGWVPLVSLVRMTVTVARGVVTLGEGSSKPPAHELAVIEFALEHIYSTLEAM